MSSKRIIGSAEILGNLAIGQRYAMRTFNGTSPNANTGIVQYPIYKRSEVQSILDMLPISRVGEMDYLPLNVSGSYEGATPMSSDQVVQPTIIEDDGTAVVLRSGTNGSTKGFYYSFIRELRNITMISQESVISTNSMYKPSIMSSTENIKYFIGSNGYEMLGCLSTEDNYIFTLTNGTFNEISHIHAKVPSTSFGNDMPLYVHIVGSKVYIWCKDKSVSNLGLALSIYTVELSDVKASSMASLTKVTGLSGQTVRNTSYSASNNIRVFDRLYSVGTSSDSLFEVTSPVSRVEFSDYTDFNIQANVSTDLSKIRVTLYPTHRMVTPLYISTVYGTGISFVYNINSKSMSLDGSARAPATVSYNNGFQVSNPFEINMVNFTGTTAAGVLGNAGGLCQTKDGLVFASKFRWSSTEFYGLQRYKVSGTPFDSWVASTRSASNVINTNVLPVFGSAVGANLLGVRFIDNRKILLACSGTYDDVTYNYNNTVFSEIGPQPTYQYNSVQHNTTLNGFAPQSNRKQIGDDFTYTAMISLVDTDGSVRCYGTSFIEGVYKTSGGLLNPDTLEFDETYTIEPTVLESLKQDIFANLGNSGIVGTLSGQIVLYYVPDNTFSKSIAVVSAYNLNNNQGYAIYAEVDVVLSGTNITSATLVSTRYETLSSVTGIITEAYMKRCTGLTVAKYSGFGYIGVDAVHQFSQPGNAQFKMMIAKTVDGVITSNRFLSSSYIQLGAAYQHGVIPGVGFGYYNFQDSDYQTKSVFSVFGTTSAEMDGLISGNGSVKEKIVVVSQDVAQGFSVYFTREVPVFLGGIFNRLPIQSVDLSTVKSNPANTTFYLYIQMNRNTKKASYVISTETIDESLTSTYIGKIVTGTSGITSIDTEKVTRFLTYRPSTTKRGSAIPASTGVPSGSGTRWK